MRDPYYAGMCQRDERCRSEGEYEATKLEAQADIQASGLPVCPYERPSALAESGAGGELEKLHRRTVPQR